MLPIAAGARIGDDIKMIKTNKNTFIVWEPHTKTHAETVPGWTKYLLDMGYRVIAVVGSNPVNDGLFRYSDRNLTVIRMPDFISRIWLKYKDFSGAAGILVASGEVLKRGKAKNQKPGYAEAYGFFKRAPQDKVFLVFHDIRKEVDAGISPEDIITLDNMDYQGAKTVVVNPHYFGEVEKHHKNKITNFVTIGTLTNPSPAGTLKRTRRNSSLLLESVQRLHDAGVRDFRVTAVGRNVRNFKVPRNLRGYFDLHNSLGFQEMFKKIESADFFLPLLDADTDANHRYITTGTSGNFQLIYGFAKPPLIASRFAVKKSFNSKNSIVYEKNADLADAMKRAVLMPAKEYDTMRSALSATVAGIYKRSLGNFEKLVKSKSSAPDNAA